ncbi:MAG TPA: C39 family peptidase [Rhizomicrobium sp.]|jgi:hypothetical protein
MPGSQPAPGVFGAFDQVSTAALGAAVLHDVLALPAQDQRMSNWCWAAAAADVANFYAPGPLPIDQCVFVRAVYAEVDCAHLPGYDACVNYNTPQDIAGALKARHHLNEPPLMRALKFDEIVVEIGHNRPVCAWMNTYEGHYVVIHGYQCGPGVQDVFIADPDAAKKFDGQHSYAELTGGAKPYWAATYLTQLKDP